MKARIIFFTLILLSLQLSIRSVPPHSTPSVRGGSSPFRGSGGAGGVVVKIVSLSELKSYYEVRNDTTYVVNFWATWCRPCLEELPWFEQINKDYSDKKVKVLLVSLDFPEQAGKLNKFLTKNKIRSKVVLLDEPDENSWIPQINEKWTGSIPATLIINNAKNYTFFHEGKITLEELENAIPQ